MAKKIIFCADGTWNGPEQETGVSATDGHDECGELSRGEVTNVVKLFANLKGHVTPESLALRNEQEKIATDNAGNPGQIAKYVHGVGDSSNPVLKVLGGAFGMGVIARIVRGYTFVSRSYEPHDEIHIVGFSRGAYTARALAGMIARVGLLNTQSYDPTDKEQAYRLGIAAWAKSKSISLHGSGGLTALANHMINFVQGFIANELPANGLIPDVPIKSVAVWDTVGSYGIPLYAGNKRFDVFRFVDNKLSDRVEHGFHAMAIDELRKDFPVTTWEDRHNVEQTWFVGAHADIGGGYCPAESQLSNDALGWMMKKLSMLDVEFATPPIYPPSRQEGDPDIHTPWNKFPFSALSPAAREVLAGQTVHASVVRRWNNATAHYRPEAMAQFNAQGLGALKVDNTSYP